MTSGELERFARELSLSSEDFDDWVHDAKSEEATSINDQGMMTQIVYLGEAYGNGWLENELKKIRDKP